MQRIAMSQSFRMGYGGIEHNLRICKGKSVRQNGIIERRFLNENLLADTTKTVDELIREKVEHEIGNTLNELNEKHIRQGHPGRVCTVDEWIKKQRYTRQGKQREIVSEYIIQVGDKYTACPYEVQKDEQGHMLDETGTVIPEWDTRKHPAYKDGNITEAAICKKLKKVYKQFLCEFIVSNPNARVLCAAIHADEHGGVHMHINVLWIAKTKNGIGIGLSKTTAMKQQYERKGEQVQNTRQNNAQNEFRKRSRELLKKVCEEYGIEQKDMGNREQYRSIKDYKKFKDEYCDELERKTEELKQKETELSSNMAKQEWYLLKTKYPAFYKKIHSEYMNYKKSVDRGMNM